MHEKARRRSGLWKQCALAMWLSVIPLAAAASDAEDRFLIHELMERYGVVHDFGTPEEYADLFTADGEIAVGSGQVVVKGRQALIAQAKRDHERYGAPPGPDGKSSSIMRHVVTNKLVTLGAKGTATGSSYVLTLINDAQEGPQVLSLSRYEDRYVKVDGAWRIAHRKIFIDSGNQALGRKHGFVR